MESDSYLGPAESYCRPFNSLVKAFKIFFIHTWSWWCAVLSYTFDCSWALFIPFMLAECCRLTVNRHIHYMKQLKHRYCRCRPLVVTFVYHEFGTLCCATKLAKVPHFCTNYCSDWKCSPVISSGDICSLISWHLSFWGCKCQEFPLCCLKYSSIIQFSIYTNVLPNS